LGCLPIKALHELGSDRRETGRSLSAVGVSDLRGAAQSQEEINCLTLGLKEAVRRRSLDLVWKVVPTPIIETVVYKALGDFFDPPSGDVIYNFIAYGVWQNAGRKRRRYFCL
jgi:hypothetical protein